MQIEKMFKKDIHRDINGVVQVMQDSEKYLEQELSEYVVTRELRNHFSTFFDNYEKALSHPTDKVGVWISGFFGSGKSHFLKMLSYLLENREVQGKNAVKYFEDKFEDPMQYAVIEQCAKVPTETILFNIDQVGPQDKDKTVILRIFAKMFYEHLGFYGDDLKVARLEMFIDSQGKTEEFRQVIHDINGDSWEELRSAMAFWEDDVVAALTKVLGMSETAARNWFNGEETNDLSIDQLTDQIKAYVDRKGKEFRLLFMIDEIGQYIGGDVNLMLNLQTIVESLGTKCSGQVWVVVTSQEAVDTIIKLEGQDFSKIQARFATRLSLSSSSVDEVIKKRILAKTESATDLLRMKYDAQSGVLKNLYTFNTQVQDINKGFEDSDDFAATFPFVPYQFILIQKVMAEARKHGNTGKHMSGGERSMLSGYQEVAQHISAEDENAMAPFYMFYESVHQFLEGAIKRVIERCQRAADDHQGIEQYDVAVLKALYLIRYINDFKPTIENISILMVDSINASKITIKQKVTESLDRLLVNNYVSISGDEYRFLSDDEQDVAKAIKETPVDAGSIINSISQTIFADIYQAKKFKHGKYDFPFDAYVDNSPNGIPSGGMKLEILTVASNLYNSGEQAFIMQSKAENKAIVVMSEGEPYFDEIKKAAQIRKYAKTKNISELPESIQLIIRAKQQEANACETRAKKYIEEAIQNATFYVAGEKLTLKSGSAKDKIDGALNYLVESVYSKLDLIKKNYDSDSELLAILNGTQASLVANPNQEAIDEIEQYLNIMKAKMMPISMGDIQRYFSAIPFGWREIDIAACVAELIAADKMTIKYAGMSVAQNDTKLIGYMRKASERDKALVERRITPDFELLKKAQNVMKELTGLMDVPADEKNLVDFIKNQLSERANNYANLLNTEYAYRDYPQKTLVQESLSLVKDVQGKQIDNIAYLSAVVDKKDDLLDMEEDMSEVNSFFSSQKDVYNKALSLIEKLKNDATYLAASETATDAFRDIKNILSMDKPYRRISEIPSFMQTINDEYGQMLSVKKEELGKIIQDAMAEVHQSADLTRQKDIIDRADHQFDIFKNNASQAATITELNAMIPSIGTIKDTYLTQLARADAPEQRIEIIKKANLGYSTKLTSDAEIDEYVESIRQELKYKLADNDAVQLI